MTIQFNCPNCDAVIGFDDKHKGKKAHCTSCGQHFIIPDKNLEKAQKVKPPEEPFVPIPGFYRAVFVESWKLFVNSRNATGLVFVIAAICFKFFIGHLGFSNIIYGCLFWYYMQIISSTAYGYDELPDVGMGGVEGFIWNIFKSLFLFGFTLAAVEMPCIIFVFFEGYMDMSFPTIRWILSVFGLFVFPAAILVVAVTEDIFELFQPNHIVRPIVKAFVPNFVVVVLCVIAWHFQFVQYGQLTKSTSKLLVGLHLLINLAAQVPVIISMRAIGLFYRHYIGYFS
jgi:hypothetical protein